MESNGYYDDSFKWHVAFDFEYGLPLMEPKRTEEGGLVNFTRTFSGCSVEVTCSVTKCKEQGKDLIHNCCAAKITNTTTGLVVQ